jgi:formylglycine-generating enzyme required for sulfatase activity
VTPDPASEQSLARLIDAGAGEGTRPGELWRHTAPYRGLTAMTEADSDFFFGRTTETVEVIRALESAPDRLPVLIGNSGVGKSSLAQAGVLAALARQGWPESASQAGQWPQAFRDSRGWCVLSMRPGAEPVKALVEPFLRTWQLDATDPLWARRRAEWSEALLDGKLTLPDLLDATEQRYHELGQPEPSAFLLHLDQGEELYVRSDERQRRRFSDAVAAGLGDPRLRAFMSLRADFFGALQSDTSLYAVHRLISVPPLREAELREVVSRPAEILSARFATDGLAAHIAERTAEESTRDSGALPLLSYLLDDMWQRMVERADGVLRLPTPALDLGGVLVERADGFLAARPASEGDVRRIFTLKLATVREDGEPTRRRALRSEFTDEEWRLVSELADHPNRLLVTATLEGGETYAEVAHEAIFRRWAKLRDWIAAEREFLIWRGGFEAARRAWQTTSDGAKHDALLMGLALAQAQAWLAQRADGLSNADREFIGLSAARAAAERSQRERLRRRTQGMGALVGVLLLGVGAGLAWSNRDYLEARSVVLAETVRPKVLTAEAERARKPGDAPFKECKHCPEMVVVPAGAFTMGSPKDEKGRDAREDPQHQVTIARAFAVSRFEITSEEWDACVILGGCAWPAPETGWGRGRQPVMNVSWNDAKQYVAWLAKRTGKPYRLLSEAEWEYAARAGSDTVYSWGDEIGEGNANCGECGNEWDFKQTAPVGSFTPNAFGLYDMHGNVSEWVEDCWHDKYDGSPTDGSPWIVGGDCSRRVVRGGSWGLLPQFLRAAARVWYTSGDRSSHLGFRVGRTLTP